MEKSDVVIVGGGLSGLTAAKILKAAGKSIKLIEASHCIGGRVRTDYIDGFRFDRGFQVLLTAYPEVKAILNYKSLNLHYFDPGAVILSENGSTIISDPLRNPGKLWATLTSSAGSLADKLLVLKLKGQLSFRRVDELFGGSGQTTLDFLKNYGFSEKMIFNFFKPFFGGVFLEDELETPSDIFTFLFKMFSEGHAALPALGMGMIADQLAESFKDQIILNESVVDINENSVLTDKGNLFTSKYILLATDEKSIPYTAKQNAVQGRPVTNIYFAADAGPIGSKTIMLNSSAEKLVNNIAVLSNVSPDYAPADKSLLSVSILGDHQSESPHLLAKQAAEELSKWFRDAVNWHYLRMYQIPYALPRKKFYKYNPAPDDVKIRDGIFRCGDYLLNGSINAAMRSGRAAAEAILSM
jgi:phytoene dehydrogenase-like protein